MTWLAVQGLAPMAFTEGRYRKPGEGLLIAQALLLVAARRSGKMPGFPKALVSE
jgi:hypothetical protein